MANYFYDTNHIRYELASTHEGKPYNWLFFPGGPGADSRYFHSLIQYLELPGNVWLIDLPGNGDNLEHLPENYDFWLEIFLPTIGKFQNPIVVGHSFGSMLPLCFPEMEKCLKGLIILNSAPCLWLEEAVKYAKQYELPDLSREMQEFTDHPNPATFQMALQACMPYYFPKESLEKGRSILAGVPFRFEPAVWWQRKVIEMPFSAKWIPEKVPTLVIGATHDCIVPFSLFQNDPRFDRPNIHLCYIQNAGHLPWLEQPDLIRAAFKEFCDALP